MEYLTIILQGILLGATLSFVVGPAMFSLIQTSISQGFRSGMHFAMGIALSDLILICLVYLGFSSLFENHKTYVILSVLGGILLIVFGTYTFTRKSNVKKSKEVDIKRPFFGRTILRGFLYNIVNPSVWFYWLVPVGIATSFGNTYKTYIFLASMLVTIFSFDLLKCGISYKLKALMTDKVINVINKVVGIILIIIGVYLILVLFDKLHFLQNLPINTHGMEAL